MLLGVCRGAVLGMALSFFLPALWPATGWADSAQANVLLSEADLVTYEAAFELADKKDFAAARRLAEGAVNDLPAEVIRWRDLIRKETTAPFADFAGFLQAHPDWPRREALLRNAETAMPEAMDEAELLAWFDRHPPVTVAGAERYAAALKNAGREAEAQDLLRRVWVAFDFTAAEERAFHKAHRGLFSQGDQIARLDRLLWDRRAKAARRQARRIGDGYVELAEARLLLAYRRPGVDRAVRRVPAKLRDDPGFIYDRARWRHRKGRYEGVIALLDPPDATAPYPEFWWPLRHWAARRALDRKDPALAYRLAAAHGFEDGVGFAEGEWLAGWVALRFLDDAATARGHFERLFEGVSTPVSLARGAYWAGEAATAVGDEPAAEEWYQAAAEHVSTFYGQQAARRLGRTSFALPALGVPHLEAHKAFDRRELVQAVRLLGQLGQEKTQGLFLDRLRLDAESAEEFLLIAELAREQGRPDKALRTAKEARKAGYILSDHLFPIDAGVTLEAKGTADEPLLLSVIRQESQFYSKVVSRAGARGLMQLMPGTAKVVARRLKLPYRRARLISDPAYNVTLGTDYLAGLLERYRGERVLALAAYNAGPHRVDRWLKQFGDPRRPGVDPIDWAERIPFNETRNYVQRILEAVPIYETRLEQREALLPAEFAPAGYPETGGDGEISAE